MSDPPMIRDWARRLIASAVDAAPLSTPAEVATLRVYEKLRRHLCAPVGVDGFQALASRALSLAKSQSPSLNAVRITANGGLHGLGQVPFQLNTDEDTDVGTILIAQLLGLVLTLLGEAATKRLIEDVPRQSEVNAELDTTGTSISATDTNYFGHFEDILLEADQLRNVSERLEILAHKHADIDEMMSVAGNIRNIAAVLDVFTVIRGKAAGSQDSALLPPTNGFLN